MRRPRWRASSSGKANLLPDMIVYGTKSGEMVDPMKVENGRPRELGLMSDHNMYELVNNAGARGGSYFHAKWLQDHKGDEVRCRLVATPWAIGERLGDTQSNRH